MSDTSLPVGILCQHFELDGFDCGEDLQNQSIASRVGTFFDPQELVVLVAHEEDAIRGFLSVCDLKIRLAEADEEELCFFFAAFGVDKGFQDTDVAHDLIRRAYDLKRLRNQRDYAATVATTLHNPEFIPRLKRLRFQPVPSTNETYWFRRPGR